MTKTKLITETIVCPTTKHNSESSYNFDAFPKLKEFLDNGYRINSLTITTFTYNFEDENGQVPQLNVLAFLSKEDAHEI